MDDQFEFSFFMTREEWEADRRHMEEFNRNFDRQWRERHRETIGDKAAVLANVEEPF